ncbi:MAG: hypothetical protein NZ737_00975 [Candidatus Poseidoniaceae archaeon]|nr:hypothetical protein [Candidatus Poseidoniaceae archaeon]
MRVLALLIGVILLALPVAGHELAVYTVIYGKDGAMPADIPDGSLKEGDQAWLWMKDSTENSTLVVTLEKNGVSYSSTDLTTECELDDNGSKVNEDCETRFDFSFDQSNAAGEWKITFSKSVNGSETSTEVGSVVIEADHHSQEESIEGFSKTNIAILVAVASVIGMLLLISQMMESSSEEE